LETMTANSSKSAYDRRRMPNLNDL